MIVDMLAKVVNVKRPRLCVCVCVNESFCMMASKMPCHDDSRFWLALVFNTVRDAIGFFLSISFYPFLLEMGGRTLAELWASLLCVFGQPADDESNLHSGRPSFNWRL